MPIKRKYQKITSPYGNRIRYGKEEFHRGVDLHSTNFSKKVITTEDSTVTDFGKDRYGNNYIIFKPMETVYIKSIKYIHVKIKPKFLLKKLFIPEGIVIGKTEIAGNSSAHHLHFEIWNLDNKHLNPVPYLKLQGFKFK